MSRDQTGLRAVLREIAQSAERSSLFWWMVEHHQALTEASKDRRLPWRSLCVRFAELGLADATGKPATPETARLTLRRARKAIAEAQRRAAAAKPSRPGSVYPSRISPDWRPQQVVPPAMTTPASSLPALASAGAGPAALPAPHVPRPAQLPFADDRTQEEIDAYVDEQLSLIDEELKAYDRKRFGFGGG